MEDRSFIDRIRVLGTDEDVQAFFNFLERVYHEVDSLQKENKELSKLANGYIALSEHYWELHDRGLSRSKLLVPPITDERYMWTAMWDKNGLPHWLPDFIKGEK
jgi:hypothetical protein